jgi:hypothetical protein
MLRDLLAALFLLELVARIVAPQGAPYLISFTGAEPMTDFEEALYAAMEGADVEY